MRQSDQCVMRAMRHLADVLVTVDPQHPELAQRIYVRLLLLEYWRQEHLLFYRQHWSGTERCLWKEGELAIIISEAQVLSGTYAVGDPAKGQR